MLIWLLNKIQNLTDNFLAKDSVNKLTRYECTLASFELITSKLSPIQFKCMRLIFVLNQHKLQWDYHIFLA